MQMHLNILLELHETADVSQAFQHFSSWINEGVDELTFIKSLTKMVCSLLAWFKLLFNIFIFSSLADTIKRR